MAAAEVVLDARVRCKVFYDIDTPVTLACARAGRRPSYLGPGGLGRFDLVLSAAGGAALDELVALLGARRVASLHEGIDPDVYLPALPREAYRADLSYLDPWAAERAPALEALLVEAARRRPDRPFLVGGALYPHSYPWPSNVGRIEHVPAGEQPAFFASARVSLRLGRASGVGYCPPSGLFAAAACGAAIVAEPFEGIDRFFTPGREILLARSTDDVLAALDRSDEDLARLGRAARERALEEHTAGHRALALCAAVETAAR
jgi:spore maturation protein CgeB